MPRWREPRKHRNDITEDDGYYWVKYLTPFGCDVVDMCAFSEAYGLFSTVLSGDDISGELVIAVCGPIPEPED